MAQAEKINGDDSQAVEEVIGNGHNDKTLDDPKKWLPIALKQGIKN